MKVKELIAELEKCNPDDVVMFEELEDIMAEDEDAIHSCSIDDVMICGTQKGSVYLVGKP